MYIKLLSFTLIIQILFLILCQLTFNLPRFAIILIEDMFKSNIYSISIGNCNANIWGDITIQNLYIRKNDDFKPHIFYSKMISFDISFRNIMTNSYMPDEIKITDCNLFNSMTGEFTPAINELSGTLTTKNNKTSFDLSGYSNSSQINLIGSLNHDTEFLSNLNNHHIDNINFNYNIIHAKILKLSNIIKRISKISNKFFIGIDININDHAEIKLFTEINNFNYNQLSFDSCITSIELYSNQNNWIVADADLLITNFKFQNKNNLFTFPNLYINSQKEYHQEIDSTIILRSALTIPEAYVNGTISVNDFSIYCTNLIDSELILFFKGGIVKGNSFICVNGQFSLQDFSIEIMFDSQILVSDISHSVIYGMKFVNHISSPIPIRINSNRINLSDRKLTTVELNININDLIINRSSSLTLSSNIFYLSGNPIVKIDFLGKIGSSHLNGFFLHDLTNFHSLLGLRGNCLPTDLNPFIRDWWDEIWEDFSFDAGSPYIDFILQGAWGASNANITTNGYVSFDRVRYNNLTLSKGDLQVSVSREQTNISEINLLLEKGELEGNLCFSRSKPGEPQFLSFDMNGSLNPPEAKSAFGLAAEKILSRFETNSTVNLDAKGYIQLNAKESTDSNTTNFLIKANTDSKILYSGIVLDSLSLEVNSTSDATKVRPLAFKIADGNGSGSLVFRHEKDLTKLELDIDIKGADRKHFVQSMQLSETLINKEEEQLNLESNGSASRGKLDFKLQAIGNPEDLLSFEGNGSILVQDPELGDIRLLGGLTDFLGASKLPLPSGSISFNRLEAPFILNGDELRFGNLNLAGGSALLVANGIINLSKHVLDLEARLHLLGNVSVPVLGKLMQLLDPLSAVGNIKIDGTFEDPKWSIQLRPGKSALDVLFPKKPHSDKN